MQYVRELSCLCRQRHRSEAGGPRCRVHDGRVQAAHFLRCLARSPAPVPLTAPEQEHLCGVANLRHLGEP
eukprot:74969-Lingulodinium_polyedra.AAC.1